jgi:hypothetical protein
MSRRVRCSKPQILLILFLLAALAGFGCAGSARTQSPKTDATPQTEAIARPVLINPTPTPIILPACGNLAQACCQPGNTCGVNLICVGGTCAGAVPGPCGAAGQSCCQPGNTCDSGLRCNANGICRRPCGMAGETCCDTNPRCQSPLVCNANGICRQPCGGAGQSCCRDGSPPCGNGLTCSAGGSCVACGGINQPCCANGCGAGLGCFSGTCRACGQFTQPCCPGGVNGLCDFNLYCAPNGTCDNNCGNKGQPCCTGNFCRLPATCNGTTCN